MGFLNKEVESTILLKRQNTNNKTEGKIIKWLRCFEGEIDSERTLC